jgi:hypothetical protein
MAPPERHVAAVGALDLVLDLEAREERHVVAVELHLVHVRGHHRAHERDGLLVDVRRVDEDLADVGLEEVADGAHHQARLQVDEAGALLLARRRLDGVPELQEVVQVPLHLLERAADAGRARDEAHALGDLELVHDLAQLVPVLALDPPRDPAAARVVGHEDQVAAGERDVGGERRALVAALVLVHLHDHFLPDAQVRGHLRAAVLAVVVDHELLGDFLERQEAVALGAVVDERRLEGGLHPGDDTLVDVALPLFLAGGFDVEVDEFLTVDDCDPEFLRLGRVEKHSLHRCSLPRSKHGRGPFLTGPGTRDIRNRVLTASNACE